MSENHLSIIIYEIVFLKIIINGEMDRKRKRLIERDRKRVCERENKRKKEYCNLDYHSHAFTNERKIDS